MVSPAEAAAMDPLPTETREHLLLWAAREAGVLEALVRRAGTPAELAREVDIPADAAERLVHALDAHGYLRRVGDAYEPTNRLLGFLATRDVRSVGDLPLALDTLSAWVALPDTLAGADAPRPDTRSRLGAAWKAEEAAVRAVVTAGERRAPDAREVVVLHDGPGRHAREFRARGRTVTLLDTAARLGPLGPLLAATDIDSVAGDPRDRIPDAGLVFGVGVGERYAPAGLRAVLASAREAAPVVVLVERLRGDADAALRRVELLASGDAGDCYSADQWETWLAEAGFEPDCEAVPGTDRHAIVGRVIE
jgi:hypothetical protein